MTLKLLACVYLDTFPVTVARHLRPDLQGKPVLIGGSPQQHGQVIAASSEALAQGIHAGMATWEALRRCPRAILEREDPAAARSLCQQVIACLAEYGPRVDQAGPDRFFLELTCGESPLVEGRTIQQRLQQDLGLSPSVGIATNRLVAEIAACSPGLGAACSPGLGAACSPGLGAACSPGLGAACSPGLGAAGDRELGALTACGPGSVAVAPPGEEMAFLAPLPTGCLPGLDAALRERLGGLGLHRIADLQSMPSGILTAHFGKEGRRLYHLARGYEDTAALPTISAARLFDHRMNDPEDLRRWTILLCSQVGRQLRARQLAARGIRLTIGHPDRPPTVLTGRLAQPGDVDQVLFLTALQALQNCRLPEEGVNSLELEANGLEEKSLQLPLLPDRSARRNEKLRLINNAANRIEGKHGEGVILVASVLHQEILSRLRGSRHGWAI